MELIPVLMENNPLIDLNQRGDSLLQTKIKQVLAKCGLSIVEIAKACGVPKENMYKWSKGTRPSDPIVYNKLISSLDKFLQNFPGEYIGDDTNGGYTAQHKPLKVRMPLKDSSKPCCPTNEKAIAGTVLLIDDEPQLIAERIEIPFLGTIDGAVEISDDSMEPIFKRGCRVAIIRLPDIRILTWGKNFFIIDKNLQGIIRRIYPGKDADTILLVSENAQFPPLTRHWDQIEAIFIVTAGILKH